MNDQTITPNNTQTPIEHQPIDTKASFVTNIKNKVFPVFAKFWLTLKESKFYKNKMVFWPVTIMLALVLITLILGLMFGRRNLPVSSLKPASPTPPSENQNTQQTKDGGELSQIEQKLVLLKDRITSLDTKQSRLQAPSVNFDVKF